MVAVGFKHSSLLVAATLIVLFCRLPQARTASDTNSLVGVNGTWIGDGSDGGTWSAVGSTTSDNDISIASATRGTPFHVMFDAPDILPTSSFFFETTIVELKGSIAIGVVRKDEFRPGWRTRGMFYNGNLCNGITALIGGFGASLKSGDKVGVYLQRNETAGVLQIVYYVNDVCLGPAFRLENVDAVADQSWYPSFHVSGEAKVAYNVPEYLPDTIERQSAFQAGSYVGDWELTQLFSGPELREFPLPKDQVIVLTFQEREPSRFRLSIQVTNRMSCEVEIVGELESFDEVQVGRVASTKMLPPAELRELENLIRESLPTVNKMVLSDKTLIMTGAEVEFIAERHFKTFEPLPNY